MASKQTIQLVVGIPGNNANNELSQLAVKDVRYLFIKAINTIQLFPRTKLDKGVIYFFFE